MKRVVIESPYRGDTATNERYAECCLIDCLARGEAPFASHLLYTRVLRDCDGRERAVGMIAGWAWYRGADLCAVYQDCGISDGMTRGIEAARANGVPVQYRRCSEWRG